MIRLVVPFGLFAALLACAPEKEPEEEEETSDPLLEDSDGDGLTNGEEADLGTDPDEADSDDDGLEDSVERDAGTDPLDSDSDSDGLIDGAELEHETDPNDPDSDGDGYRDGDEVVEGSDPTDDTSLIYLGHWAYQADKDSFEGPDLEDAEAEAGERFARLQVQDQFGEVFDLYDLAGHGKPILVDISAIWCGPCNGLSQWLSGTGDDYDWNGSYPHIKEMVDSGDIYWVTVLGETNTGMDPKLTNIQAWDEKYPNENVPVLVGDSDIADKYVLGGWPSVYFLGEEMEIQALPVGTSSRFYDALDTANDYQP